MKRTNVGISAALSTFMLIGCVTQLGVDVPDDAVELPDAVVAATTAAWQSAGLPDASSCQAPWWADVGAERFRDSCRGLRPCSQPRSEGEQSGCLWACSWVGLDGTAMAYGDLGSFADDPKLRIRKQVHEVLHVFGTCTLDDNDPEHVVSTIWDDAYEAAIIALDANL